MFRSFGGAGKKEGAQNSPSVPASNLQSPSNSQDSSANWFKSLINKGKKASKQVFFFFFSIVIV